MQVMKNGVFDSKGVRLLPPVKKIDAIGVVPFGAKTVKVEFRPNKDKPIPVSKYVESFKNAVGLYRIRALDEAKEGK